MTHRELVDIGAKWLKNRHYTDCHYHAACSVILKEITSLSEETPDVIGFSGYESILIEAKASRSDFLADGKKFHRVHPEYGVGNCRYYICEEGLIKVSELPHKWGLLYVKNDRVSVEKWADVHSICNFKNERKILLSYIRRILQDKNLSKIEVK